jgi:hypothetical protein
MQRRQKGIDGQPIIVDNATPYHCGKVYFGGLLVVVRGRCMR